MNEKAKQSKCEHYDRTTQYVNVRCNKYIILHARTHHFYASTIYSMFWFFVQFLSSPGCFFFSFSFGYFGVWLYCNGSKSVCVCSPSSDHTMLLPMWNVCARVKCKFSGDSSGKFMWIDNEYTHEKWYFGRWVLFMCIGTVILVKSFLACSSSLCVCVCVYVTHFIQSFGMLIFLTFALLLSRISVHHAHTFISIVLRKKK